MLFSQHAGVPWRKGVWHFPWGQARSPSVSRQLFIASLRRLLNTLTDSGHKVILIGQVPSGSLNPITCEARARFNHWRDDNCRSTPAALSAGTESSVSSALSAAAAENPDVLLIHPFNILCEDGTCKTFSKGRPLYWDSTHLSFAGTQLLETSIENGLTNSLKTP